MGGNKVSISLIFILMRRFISSRTTGDENSTEAELLSVKVVLS